MSESRIDRLLYLQSSYDLHFLELLQVCEGVLQGLLNEFVGAVNLDGELCRIDRLDRTC